MRPAVNPVWKIVFVRAAQASALALALHWLLHWPLAGPRALGLFFTPLLCLYFLFVFVAPWSWGLPIRTRLPERAQTVALTFDDGPSAEATPTILDALARHGVRATFFVLGEAVERRPDLVRRMAAEGHGIGIHGHRHAPFVLLSGGEVRREIRRTRRAIQEALPETREVVWLRPPHGFKTLTLPWIARRAGCRLAAWTVNAHDYAGQDSPEITRRALGGVRPGAIILMHDGPQNGATAAALPSVLEGLRERGYSCAPLD